MNAGKVTLVGAGPGDPELLTVKAVKALQAATVLLVDDLVNPEIVKLASPGARVIHVGKRGGCKSTPQAFIEKLMVMAAREGENVVRLKGGDPFIFGRGGEEVEHLQQADVHFPGSYFASYPVPAGAPMVPYPTVDVGAIGTDDAPGQVWVVDGEPIGDDVLDDVAGPSLVGTAADRLGSVVAVADLDGDQYGELLAGAPGSGCVYAVSWPWLGEIATADADWTFCGDHGLGATLALGDFDGDGRMDLAAGAPDDGPGQVLIWSAPARGRHDPSDATVLRPGDAADGFGAAMVAGDFDGDGVDDLAIGAPQDQGAGAVYLLRSTSAR